MKKLLLVILAFVGITSVALAEPQEYKSGDFVCARVDTKLLNNGKVHQYNGEPFSYASIYFDTGSAKAHEGCEEHYKQMATELQAKKNDIQEVVFIGSADSQGDKNNFNNNELAYKRVQYVEKLLIEKDGKVLIRGTFYDAGAEHAKAFSSKTNNKEFRSVFVYVIWKLPTCDNETMNNIESLKESLASYNGSEKQQLDSIFTDLDKICNQQGNSLTVSDSEQYTKLLSELAQLVYKVNEANPTLSIDLGAVTALGINAAYANLSQTRNNLGLTTSKWKNAEGKFNTARLVSDSVAGVVLGTAGGLIASHLVKKGQIKNGFEDIRCTIGGQQVADWGDEFTVGVR